MVFLPPARRIKNVDGMRSVAPEIKDETKVILLSLKGLGEDMDEVKKQKLIGACQTVLSAVEKQIDIKTS